MTDVRPGQIGPVESDGSMEIMYSLFKMDHPKGSVVQFQAWFHRLCQLQRSVPLCPFCGALPMLRVHEYVGTNPYPEDNLRHEVQKVLDPDGIRYDVVCENSDCQVQPHLTKSRMTPEEAIAAWSQKL